MYISIYLYFFLGRRVQSRYAINIICTFALPAHQVQKTIWNMRSQEEVEKEVEAEKVAWTDGEKEVEKKVEREA